jgi:transcriptional regulator with XRE-family HTH domain
VAEAGDAMNATMWARPDMRQALANHDLQTVFRLMQRHGLPQRAIAALTGLAQSDVSAIVCGRRQIMAYGVLERLAQGLGLPRGWLGLAYDEESARLVGPVPP